MDPQNRQLTVESRSQEFVPTEGSRQTTSAELILVLAYACFWVLVFGFVYQTYRRQKHVEARLGALERALEQTKLP